VPGDCPGVDNDCRTRTCDSGTCGVLFVPPGTVAGPQTAGDCYQNECDGDGALASVYVAADIGSDDDACTSDTCSVAGMSYVAIGNGSCRGVCVVPADAPAFDGGGNQIGVFGAGIYATCGSNHVAPATPPPGQYEMAGVKWKNIQDQTRTCGDSAKMLAYGVWSPGVCPAGAPCHVVLRYTLPGGASGSASVPGTCD
jgi:hypothetical protein